MHIRSDVGDVLKVHIHLTTATVTELVEWNFTFMCPKHRYKQDMDKQNAKSLQPHE